MSAVRQCRSDRRLIHEYDQIGRDVTWTTLTKDLPAWREALAETFDAAETLLEEEAERSRGG